MSSSRNMMLVSRRGEAAPSVACLAAPAALVSVRISFAKPSRYLGGGGAYRDRTDDLMLAKQPLSQLS